MSNRKRRLRLGDIYEIPLPDGTNAYGRLYKDLLQDGEWKIVATRKFISEEDAWAPPKCVIDAITGIGSLYYKGMITTCSYEECKDLEIAAVWDRHHLIDRLMGNDVWEKSLGKPKDTNQ